MLFVARRGKNNSSRANKVSRWPLNNHHQAQLSLSLASGDLSASLRYAQGDSLWHTQCHHRTELGIPHRIGGQAEVAEPGGEGDPQAQQDDQAAGQGTQGLVGAAVQPALHQGLGQQQRD